MTADLYECFTISCIETSAVLFGKKKRTISGVQLELSVSAPALTQEEEMYLR